VVTVFVLAVGVVGAATSESASFAPDTVVRTFAENGFTLREFSPEGPSSTGWTGYGPLVVTSHGRLFFPESVGGPRFYVFVAANDDRAHELFAPLADVGGGPEVFDRLQGNVVVRSDASLAETGLNADERRRIDAALRDLADTS
jgi:hypothetical protein